MIKRTIGSLGQSTRNIAKLKSHKFNQQREINNQFNNTLNGNFIIQYSFARRLFKSQHKDQEKPQIIISNVPNTKKQQISHKDQAPEIYTFTDLDSDLQKYQSFLNIFNTHSKKPHEKLLINQTKIISTIIQKNRNDLLQKFLAINYRNRLANPQTINLIYQHFKKQLLLNVDKIIDQTQYCQLVMERITLLTEFHQFSLFDDFCLAISNKLQIKNDSNKNLKILDSLPSKESQLFFMYNLLMKQKDLPLQIMQSKHFGLNTDNLTFHKLGQIFYEFRKFIRRYFALFSKNNEQNKKQELENQSRLHSFQKQSNQTTQASLIQQNVFCFLKTINLKSVRKQILIDGFAVDFVIEKNSNTQKNVQNQRKDENIESYILQVMGSYHYTSTQKLKGRDLRKLILLGSKYRSKRYFVKILHFDEYNKSKGHRNKMELIKHLLESKDQGINWQSKKQGYDSKWQLKQVYEQFK